MNNEEPKIYQYKKSFLLFWHILLGGSFVVYTFVLIDSYTRNIMQGTLLTLTITLSYLYILYMSAKAFNKQQIGFAYFLTVAGFLVGLFVQLIACVNSITINMH